MESVQNSQNIRMNYPQYSTLRFKDRSNSPYRAKEEEQYDNRRVEEIRKQLNEKEKEIGQLNRASSYLQSRLDDPNKFASFGPEQISQNIPKSGFHVKEHIANLQSDNASLMRRLNLVLQELERVQKERENLQNRLKQVQREQQNVQAYMDGEDGVDKANKYMQEDILYERDKNISLRTQTQDSTLDKQKLLKELDKMGEQCEGLQREGEQVNRDLGHSLQSLQELEKEHFYTVEKIKQRNEDVNLMREKEEDQHIEIMDFGGLVQQLQMERNDMLCKQDNLNRKYDEVANEINGDRNQMQRQNLLHNQLVTAKIIFVFLSQAQKRNLRESFNEIQAYCKFDKNCNTKLHRFSELMLDKGQSLLRQALQLWFQNGLQPVKTRRQQLLLGRNRNRLEVKQKMFNIWRNKYLRRHNQYDQKTSALNKFWGFLCKDANLQIQIFFAIWKKDTELYLKRKQTAKKLIYGVYFKRINQGFNLWYQGSKDVTYQVRLILLNRKLAVKQYKQILWGGMRQFVQKEKLRKYNIKFHYWKAWQEYRKKSKFMVGAQSNVLRFLCQGKTGMLKKCFDALRVNKMAELSMKSEFELQENELKKVADLEKKQADQSKNQYNKSAKRACQAIVNQASRNVFGYFQKWKQYVEAYKEFLFKRMKGRILTVYQSQLRSAFNTWKKNKNQGEVQQQEFVMMEEQSMGQQMQDESINLQKEVQNKKEQLDCSSRKSTNKAIKNMLKRFLRRAFARWRERISTENVKEDGADYIIKKINRRILKKGFDRYKEKVKMSRKDEGDADRSQYMVNAMNEKLKRKCFNKLQEFNLKFRKSKQNLGRIFGKVDRLTKEKAFKRWRQGGRTKMQMQMEEQQNQMVQEISQLNSKQAHYQKQKDCSSHDVDAKQKFLKKQAQRIISNAFVSFYGKGTAQGFEKWKQWVILQKQREVIMKRMIERWKQSVFKQFKQSFKNWIQLANIQEQQTKLKEQEMRISDKQEFLQRQTNEHSNNVMRLTQLLNNSKGNQDSNNIKMQKGIQLLIKKNDQNHYMSNKRYILQRWREYVKRQKHFVICIEKVISKSLWNQGFNTIKQNWKGVGRQDNLEKGLNRFRMKFWKSLCGHAFSKWRYGAYATVKNNTNTDYADIDMLKEKHQQEVAARKDFNRVKILGMFMKQNKQNVFHAWKNVINLLKLNRQAQKEYIINKQESSSRWALVQWKQRMLATRRARHRVSIMRNKYNLIKKRRVFDQLRIQFKQCKEFLVRIGNLANIHDQQGLQMAFNAIISYSKAKQLVCNKRKGQSSKDFSVILHGLFERKMRDYLNNLRVRGLANKNERQKKIFSVMKAMNNKIRAYFLRWKHRQEEEKLKDEINEEGEVRDQILEGRVEIKNLQNFLKSEGYNNQEIEQAMQKRAERKRMLLNKGLSRIQHFNSKLFCKPKYFDKWREYVHLRKLFRYWLQHMIKQNDYVACDIQRAFRKWKDLFKNGENKLIRMKKDKLVDLSLKNAKEMGLLSDFLNGNENELTNLNRQREALVESYIKSQKLAFVIWKNHNKKVMHQAFLRWFRNQAVFNLGVMDQKLRNQIEMIGALKERIKILEHDNDTIADENEELRQFSIDGYEIAKNVKMLSSEREKLSVDLADKAQTIKNLLDENEQLNEQLTTVQSDAQHILDAANHKMAESGMSPFRLQ